MITESLTSTPPLVSICIPTYNRAPFLRALLQSIASALPADDVRVEILVSDNAGTDDTTIVIEEMRRLLPALKFHRNDVNLGAEGNMAGLIDRSRGRYIWLFGDDDLMLDHTFQIVIPALLRDPDFLVLNYMTVDRTGTICTDPSTYSDPTDHVIADKNELLTAYGLRLGLTTGVILRREACLEVSRENYLRHAASGLSYFYLVLMIGHQRGNGYYVATPVIQYRSNNSDHSPSAERWVDVYGRSLRELTKELAELGYSPNALKVFYKKIIKDYYAFCIMGDRIQGKSTYFYYKSLIKDYSDVPWAWLMLMSICIPKWGASSLKALWRLRARLLLSKIKV